MPVKKTQKKKQMSNTKRIDMLEREVKKIDLKRKSTTKSEVAFNTNTTNIPIFELLNGISRGTGDNQMIGDTLFLRGINYKFLLHSNSTDKAQLIRFCIIKSQNTITNVGEQFFINTDGDAVDFDTTTEQQKFVFSLNTRKYDVVLQKIVKLGAKNITYGNQFDCNQIVSDGKRYKGTKISYNTDAFPNHKYYLCMWSMLAGMDTSVTNWGITEVTGRVNFFYSDE